MKFKKIMYSCMQFSLMLSLTAFGMNCGGSSATSSDTTDTTTGTTSTTPQAATIAALPSTSGQVVSGSTVSSSLSSLRYVADEDVDSPGDFEEGDFSEDGTGFSLDDLGSDADFSNMNFGACQMANTLAETRERLLETDVIGCYINNIMGLEANADIVINDGEFHHYALDFSSAQQALRYQVSDDDSQSGEGDDGGPASVFVKVVFDAGGTNVIGYEMGACDDEGAQNQYISKSIATSTNGGSIISEYKSTFEAGSFSGSFSDSTTASCTVITVDGSVVCVDSLDGENTPKVINVTSRGSSDSDDFAFNFTQRNEVKQFSKFWEIRAQSAGEDSFGDSTCEFSFSLLGIADLYDKNTDAADWSAKNVGLGKGLAVLSDKGVCTGGESEFANQWGIKAHFERWDNKLQTVETPTDSQFHTLLNTRFEAGELGSLTTETFAFSKAIDCSSAKVGTLTVSNAAISSCDEFSGGSHTGVNCFMQMGEDAIDDEFQMAEGSGFDEGQELTLGSCSDIETGDVPSGDKIDELCECLGATFEECEYVQSNHCFEKDTVGECLDAINEVSDFETEVARDD